MKEITILCRYNAGTWGWILDNALSSLQWLVSRVIVDNLHHLGDEDLHVVGPLHAPLDDLLVVGVDAGVVLDHAHVGDQAAGEHLHPAVVRHDGLGDGAHAHRVHSCTGVENSNILTILTLELCRYVSLPSSLSILSSATVS